MNSGVLMLHLDEESENEQVKIYKKFEEFKNELVNLLSALMLLD